MKTDPLITQFRKALKVKYEYTSHDIRVLRNSFYPVGFMDHNPKLIDKVLNSYDLNSAYAAVIYNEKFPFDTNMPDTFHWTDITYEKYKTLYKEINTVWVNFTYKGKRKYKDNTYEMFFAPFKDKFDNSDITFATKIGENKYKAVMTSLDLDNLMDLYEIEDLHILAVLTYNNIHEIPKEAKDMITYLYDQKKQLPDGPERDKIKEFLNKYIYGKNVARNFDKTRAMGVKSYTPYTVFGLWVPAYVRRIMVKTFLKYSSYAAYIDTDCIKMTAKMTENVGNELGQFKCDYEDVNIHFCRTKVYFVFKNGKLIDQKTSGFNKITENQIAKLMEKHELHLPNYVVYDIFHDESKIIDARIQDLIQGIIILNQRRKENEIYGKK